MGVFPVGALTFPCLEAEVVSHLKVPCRRGYSADSPAAVKRGLCHFEVETRRDMEAGLGGLYRDATGVVYPPKLAKGVITAPSHSFLGSFIQHLCVPDTPLNQALVHRGEELEVLCDRGPSMF